MKGIRLLIRVRDNWRTISLHIGLYGAILFYLGAKLFGHRTSFFSDRFYIFAMMGGIGLVYTLLEILKSLDKERHVQSWDLMSHAARTIISDIKAASRRRSHAPLRVTFVGVRLRSILGICKELSEAARADDWGKRRISLRVLHIHPDFIKHPHFVCDPEFNYEDYKPTLESRENDIVATFRSVDSIDVEIRKYHALPHVFGVLIEDSQPVCYIGVYQWDPKAKRWSSERNWCVKLGNQPIDRNLADYFTDRCALLEELSQPRLVDKNEPQAMNTDTE